MKVSVKISNLFLAIFIMTFIFSCTSEDEILDKARASDSVWIDSLTKVDSILSDSLSQTDVMIQNLITSIDSRLRESDSIVADSLINLLNELKEYVNANDTATIDSLLEVISNVVSKLEASDSTIVDSLSFQIVTLETKLDSLLNQDYGIIVEGKVYDALTNQPIIGAKVEILENGMICSTSADIDTTEENETGYFRFVFNRATSVGPLTLYITKDGYNPKTVNVATITGVTSITQYIVSNVGPIYLDTLKTYYDTLKSIAETSENTTLNIVASESNVNKVILASSPIIIRFNRSIDTTYHFDLYVIDESTGDTLTINRIEYKDYMRVMKIYTNLEEGYSYSIHIENIWGIPASDVEDLTYYAEKDFDRWVITYKKEDPVKVAMYIPTFDTTSVIIVFDRPITNPAEDAELYVDVDGNGSYTTSGVGGSDPNLTLFEYGRLINVVGTLIWERINPSSGYANAIRFRYTTSNGDFDIKNKNYYITDKLKDILGRVVGNLPYNPADAQKLPDSLTLIATY